MANKKDHKPYPTIDERIAIAEQKVVDLQKMIDKRIQLIKRTENQLEIRKAELEKTKGDVEEAAKKRDKLIEMKNRPPKVKAPAVPPEIRKQQRLEAIAKAQAARKAKKAQMDELTTVLKESGKSVEELLAILKK